MQKEGQKYKEFIIKGRNIKNIEGRSELLQIQKEDQNDGQNYEGC